MRELPAMSCSPMPSAGYTANLTWSAVGRAFNVREHIPALVIPAEVSGNTAGGQKFMAGWVKGSARCN